MIFLKKFPEMTPAPPPQQFACQPRRVGVRAELPTSSIKLPELRDKFCHRAKMPWYDYC